MIKPVIGLTPQRDMKTDRIYMNRRYTDAITASGGLPVTLVQYGDPDDIAASAGLLDGILFTGGVDIHPKRYGEEIHPQCGEIDEERDAFELALYAEAIRRGMPVFGICRGAQLVNVGGGGTLLQHIDGHSGGVLHKIRITGPLRDIMGSDSITVNSFHHQAVLKCAPSMEICAQTPELAEAICSPRAPFLLAVQWHPEIGYREDECSRKLFSAFIAACAAYRG
ncbi:MAG: gamma-glutamyl-gamma-aminobutyrate hydrolase family protein [Eubacteriales bacterium]|jgi:putative glutamine amidotransferase|nr:gamma-glutamyl-gamma-aminobutyrate hydrolase family protein [Eubacteriales bacterium]